MSTTIADAFAEAAAQDGIALLPQTFDWLCEQGHVGLERVAKARRDPAIVAPVVEALALLATIFARLRGDVSVLHAARENLFLPVDLVHVPSGTLLAIDGPEHLTSSRLLSLDQYPADAALGFEIDAYRALCREWAPSSDGLARGMPAKGFGFGGVQRERAYHDALRDLATPAMGHPPMLRIAAPDGDGAGAYRRQRATLLRLARVADPPTRPPPRR